MKLLMVALFRNALAFRQGVIAAASPQLVCSPALVIGVANSAPPPLPRAVLPSETEKGRPVRQKILPEYLPPADHLIEEAVAGIELRRVEKSALKLCRIS